MGHYTSNSAGWGATPGIHSFPILATIFGTSFTNSSFETGSVLPS